MKFDIVCDSSADLPEEYTRKAGVTVVPFYVSLDGKTYLKEGTELSVTEFYQTMVDHPDCFPKTSMPSVQDYINAFLPSVEKGMPVLCLCLTKKFSGSLQSAANARMLLLEDHPDARIIVMDSQMVAALEGLLVAEAVRLRDLDLEPERAASLLEGIRGTGRIFFTTKDLKYLQHGGRLSKAARIAGTVLNLKPVLTFRSGELAPVEISRGTKKSLEKVTANFLAHIKSQKIDLREYTLATGIGHPMPEFEAFSADLHKRIEALGMLPAMMMHTQIGATIGVHTGPFPVGFGILQQCRL